MNNISLPPAPLMEFMAPLDLHVTQPVLMDTSAQLAHLTVVPPHVLHLELLSFRRQPLREERGQYVRPCLIFSSKPEFKIVWLWGWITVDIMIAALAPTLTLFRDDGYYISRFGNFKGHEQGS